MKALIYKDMFVLKQKGQIFSLLSNIVMMIAIGVLFRNLYGLALIVVLSIPIGASAFIQIVMEKEEKTNFDKRIISLPVTKKEIVLARFITSFMYFGLQMLIALIYAIVHVYAFESVTLDIALILWFIGILLGICMIGINSVGYHLLGAKKGTFVYMVILAISIIAYLVVFLGFDVTQLLALGSVILMIIACLVTVLCTVICYYVSLKIFERKYS